MDNIYTNTDKSDKSVNSRAVSVMIKKKQKKQFLRVKFSNCFLCPLNSPKLKDSLFTVTNDKETANPLLEPDSV